MSRSDLTPLAEEERTDLLALLRDLTAEEWDETFRTNIYAQFYLCQAAIPHMKPGASIINTTSINAKTPSPQLLAYATTKGAIANFTAGLAGMVAKKGIRVNAVAPGPIWTPLIPSTMPEEKVRAVAPVPHNFLIVPYKVWPGSGAGDQSERYFSGALVASQ